MLAELGPVVESLAAGAGLGADVVGPEASGPIRSAPMGMPGNKGMLMLELMTCG